MRRNVLWASVRRILGTDDELCGVAYMWRSNGFKLPLVVLVLGSGFAFLIFGSVTSIIAIGLGAAVVAGWATTEYRVLAWTGSGLALMKGSRVRQVAVGSSERLPPTDTVELVSNNLVISEWRVGEHRYSVMRRFESTMSSIADAFPP